MPLAWPIPNVALALLVNVKVPVPFTRLVPQSRLPLVTVNALGVLMVKSLFNVSEAPAVFMLKFILSGVNVPADCVNCLLAPVKLKAIAPLPPWKKVPPVCVKLPPRLTVPVAALPKTLQPNALPGLISRSPPMVKAGTEVPELR